MGLDVGGNTITLAGGALDINTSIASVSMRTTGAVIRPSNALFTALGTVAGYVAMTDNNWNKLALANAILNRQACYSTANTRFTAPVDGHYLFQSNAFLHKIVATNAYWHPTFFVNGSYGKNVNPSYPNYRLRGHGFLAAGYATGYQAQVYNLVAGDYVEPFYYSLGAGNEYYSAYSYFSGFLLG